MAKIVCKLEPCLICRREKEKVRSDFPTHFEPFHAVNVRVAPRRVRLAGRMERRPFRARLILPLTARTRGTGMDRGGGGGVAEQRQGSQQTSFVLNQRARLFITFAWRMCVSLCPPQPERRLPLPFLPTPVLP